MIRAVSSERGAPPELRLTAVSSVAWPAGRPGATWRESDGRIRGRAVLSGDDCGIEWFELGRFVFSRPSPDVDVEPAPGVAPETIQNEFPGTVEPIILQALGWQVLHASAARGPHGALMFCGASGAGKSTLAYAFRHAGYQQAADDLVVLADHAAPSLWTRPFAASLREPSRSFFSRASVHADGAEAPPIAVPVRRVVFLEPGPDAPTSPLISRLDPRDAFTRILPHAHCFDPHDVSRTKAMVEHYMNLVERVDTVRAVYRPDLERLSALVAAIAG